MARVSTTLSFPFPADAAEALWLDPQRWAAFVDGFARLTGVDERWPATGGKVVWETNEGGRGRVTETVTAREPGASLTTEVDDDQLTGLQTVTFTRDEDGTTVGLALEYTIKQRNPLTPIVDRLFVRGPQRTALERTLHRFALELQDAPGAGR